MELKISSFVVASVILISGTSANADTKLPDFSQGNNPLQYCRITKVGTDSSTTQISNGQTGHSTYAHTTSKDKLGYDCDEMGKHIADVETNRADNETLRAIQNKRMQVEFLKMIFSF